MSIPASLVGFVAGLVFAPIPVAVSAQTGGGDCLTLAGPVPNFSWAPAGGIDVPLTWGLPTGDFPIGLRIVAGSFPGGANVIPFFDMPAALGLFVPDVPPGTCFADLRDQRMRDRSFSSNEITVTVSGPTPAPRGTGATR